MIAGVLENSSKMRAESAVNARTLQHRIHQTETAKFGIHSFFQWDCRRFLRIRFRMRSPRLKQPHKIAAALTVLGGSTRAWRQWP
jgi:hypothetical protein